MENKIYFIVFYIVPLIGNLYFLYKDEDTIFVKDFIKWIWIAIIPITNLAIFIYILTYIIVEYILKNINPNPIFNLFNKFLNIRIK